MPSWARLGHVRTTLAKLRQFIQIYVNSGLVG
jgi:hypothetical protein